MVVVHLLKGKVLKPALKHAAEIIEKARRLRENVNVSRPTQALIPLRTMGRNLKKVPTHALDDVLVEPVDQLVGALEPARAPYPCAALKLQRLSGGPAREANYPPERSETHGT